MEKYVEENEVLPIGRWYRWKKIFQKK
jgi:hypothetical protein